MTEYIENTEIAEITQDLLTDLSLSEFAGLRDTETTIAVLEKVKMNKEDELQKCGNPVDVKKISGFASVFINAKYVLLIDKYHWDDLSDTKKRALIHKALMSIQVQKNSDGSIKYTSRKPEIQEHIETITRYGKYNDSLTVLADILASGAQKAAEQILASRK